MKTYTPKDIIKLNYTDFIALIRETNRCPGGKNTIRKVIKNTFINSRSRVLDVGSNTGFNTFEIARLSSSNVTGIDVSESCVKESIRQLHQDTVLMQQRIDFVLGSAFNIPFTDDEFDLVFTGGATSFMNDKEKAIKEYFRVTKDWGFVCMTPLVYIQEPPKKILDAVGAAIGVKIDKMIAEDWISLVLKTDKNIELFYKEEFEFRQDYNLRLDAYINYFLNKPHIKKLPADTQEAIQKKWMQYLNIFIQNHKYLGFVILIFRKRRDSEEPELFTTHN